MAIYNFKILGIPRPKQSFRFTRMGRRYQTADVKKAEENLRVQVIQQLPDNFLILDEPLEVECVYIFPIPSSFSKKKREQLNEGKIFYKDTKPDITDNLNKGVMDAMEGVVFINDSRICKFNAVKYYGETPSISIIIKTLM